MAADELDSGIEQAMALLHAGRIDQARHRLQALAKQHPADAEAPRLLGVIALQAGDVDGAEEALAEALRRQPEATAVLCTLGAVARARGNVDHALHRYREALAIDPACAPAHNNLAGLLFERNLLAEACSHYQAALNTETGHVPARSNLAACLLQLDRGSDALAQAQRAVLDGPGYPPGWLALAQVQLAFGADQPALEAFERAIALGLGSADAWYGRAQALDELRRWPEAILACDQSLALDAGHAAAASLAQYLRRQLCRHDDLPSGQQRLFELLDKGVPGVAPFALLSEQSTPAQQRRAAEIVAAELAARVGSEADSQPALPALRTVDSSNGRIRVGFVSSGFGQHPTAILIAELIERLGDTAIEAIGYSTTADDGGPLRRRLDQAFAQLHDLSSISHAAMAQRIRADAPQVLIDLRGWGGGSAADVFARRPAPIQVNWLAYPGTSGAPWIDYLIADPYVIPEHERRHYSEAVVRLPRCFQPSDSTRTVGEPPPRSALGLAEHDVVYVCFNNSYKYSPESVARWWRIMQQVPESVLWLLAGKHPEVQQQLRTLARRAGIEPARLVFLAKQPHEAYLACYRHADLFLDTTPYNAHTTASDALWVGCPLLTRPGRTFASRVAGSLNHCLGLDELNAADDDTFVATAVMLGRDDVARRELRQRLLHARNASPLFDIAGFAHDFETVLLRMVQQHQRGLAPADFDLM